MMEQTVIPDTEAYRFMNSPNKFNKTICRRGCNLSPINQEVGAGKLTNTEIKNVFGKVSKRIASMLSDQVTLREQQSSPITMSSRSHLSSTFSTLKQN